MMFGNKKSAQEKALEKERKKYGTRKYGQTVLKTFPHGNLVLLVCRGSVPASCCCDFGCVYPARTDGRVCRRDGRARGYFGRHGDPGFGERKTGTREELSDM